MNIQKRPDYFFLLQIRTFRTLCLVSRIIEHGTNTKNNKGLFWTFFPKDVKNVKLISQTKLESDFCSY